MPAATRVENTRYESIADLNASANAAAKTAMTWAEYDPESRNQPIVPLNTGKKYVFRSRPGTLRGFGVHIPTLPDDFPNEKQEKKYTDRFIKRRAAIDGDSPKYDLDHIREVNGGEWIKFSTIPGNDRRQTTCFFATDDEQTYQFLMQCKKRSRGDWPNIIVEYPTRTVTVNGKTVPATAAGWEAAQAAFMAGDDPQE